MPYADAGNKICRPTEVQEIREGDIIVVSPATLNINGTIINFPPLSLISNRCSHEIKYLSWIEGIRIDRKIISNVIFLKQGNYIEGGELQILEPTILTAFTFKHLVGKIKGYIKEVKGVPLLSVNNIPIISIEKGKVYVGLHFSDTRETIIRLFAYSIFHYVLSESLED